MSLDLTPLAAKTGGGLHVAGQGKVCNRLSTSVIVESKHLEQPVLEMLIRIVGGRTPDEVENIVRDPLRH